MRRTPYVVARRNRPNFRHLDSRIPPSIRLEAGIRLEQLERPPGRPVSIDRIGGPT
ncbi:hypothetical protein [Natronococcus sp.]|uniref:hypothetical protein n=1 Tax=Natronococcus sp. TaxID=35747 RepID=UPI003A4DE861